MPSKPYLSHLSDPSTLRAIDPACLLELARPHTDFFANHGVILPDDPVRLNVERIAPLMLQPYPDSPYGLVDALTHIDEISTATGMETLIDEARRRGIDLPLDGPLAPADVAARVWLADPELLRRKHAEHVVLRRRSFECFLARQGASLVRPARLDESLRLFEEDVHAWFVDRGRGPGARVHVIEERDEVRLIVRHGGPYWRRGCIQAGEPGTVHFRPMDFHLVVLDLEAWELRVNCKNKGEAKLYRECIGRRLFGHADFFDERSTKYTLEPLRRLGRRSLICTDVPGLRAVRLVELTMYLGGPFGRKRTERASDVLLAFETDGDRIPDRALLTQGSLEFEFEDSRKPRTVGIGSFNRARYTRDGDVELVETFLHRRGFITGNGHAAVACA